MSQYARVSFRHAACGVSRLGIGQPPHAARAACRSGSKRALLGFEEFPQLNVLVISQRCAAKTCVK